MLREKYKEASLFMDSFSQQLEKEIVKKNLILDSFSQSCDFDKEEAHCIELELDELLYQYYRLLRTKVD